MWPSISRSNQRESDRKDHHSWHWSAIHSALCARASPTGVGLRRLVAAVAVAATAFVGSAALATPALASPAGDLGAATNAARAAAGLPALALDAQLTAVAQGWANQLAAAGTLSHNPALRTQVTNWNVLGENVGMAGDIPSVQAAFMASPAHRDNILDPRFTQMGVASATSTYASCGCAVLWVVVDFRRPATAGRGPRARSRRPRSYRR